MKKNILLSDIEIIVLHELLGKVLTEGQHLIRHPGELRTIWELEAHLENASGLLYDQEYRSKVEVALNEKWDAKLIKLDFAKILTRKDLFDAFATELNFPFDYEATWEGFEACLERFCYSNLVVQFIHFEKIADDFIIETETLKHSVNAFNEGSKFKIDVLL